MNDIIQADIFFFITSISVITLTALLVVFFWYIIRILNDIKHISSVVRDESDIISEELSQLRDNIKREGMKAKYFLSFFHELHKKTKKTAKTKRSKGRLKLKK